MVDVARLKPFRLTIVHPCVGRRIGMKRYIRTWTMEPIPAAMLAALAPREVEVRFWDDRFEPIPYDQPADLVAISVETYTARRAYQIASEFRRRRVPVVMGGFHATLCPGEVSRHCESIVLGEAELLFPQAIDDYRHGRPQKTYYSHDRPALNVTPDRSIFAGKRYLPMRLVEFSRGCRFRCDFCSIQSFFQATHNHRPLDRVLDEVRRVRRPGQMIFFIDDNLTSGLEQAKELMRALIPLRIRWVSQMAIHAAFDDEILDLMRRSGCQGLLIGFESLDESSLQQMNKGFNLVGGGAAPALANLRRHGLPVYGTFLFGYDGDTAATFAKTVEFAIGQGLFLAAFNHVTPFPGPPLYQRISAKGRMLFDAWWLDGRYRYNMVPFLPRQMSPQELAGQCVEARRRFYSWNSIARRAAKPVNHRGPFVMANFVAINAMHRWDVSGRNGLPLGDESWTGPFIEAS